MFLTLKHKHLPTQLHPHLPVYWRPRILLSSDGFSLHYQPPELAQPHGCLDACQIPKSISNLPSSITQQHTPPEIATQVLNKSSTHALPQVHWDVRPSTGRNASKRLSSSKISCGMPMFNFSRSSCISNSFKKIPRTPIKWRKVADPVDINSKVEWLVNHTLMLHVGGFVYSTKNPLWTDFLLR